MHHPWLELHLKAKLASLSAGMEVLNSSSADDGSRRSALESEYNSIQNALNQVLASDSITPKKIFPEICRLDKTSLLPFLNDGAAITYFFAREASAQSEKDERMFPQFQTLFDAYGALANFGVSIRHPTPLGPCTTFSVHGVVFLKLFGVPMASNLKKCASYFLDPQYQDASYLTAADKSWNRSWMAGGALVSDKMLKHFGYAANELPPPLYCPSCGEKYIWDFVGLSPNKKSAKWKCWHCKYLRIEIAKKIPAAYPPPWQCRTCTEESWKFLEVIESKEVALWKCAFCDTVHEVQKTSIIVSSNGARMISKQVQREVWRRDEGKCVNCGSNERLEFDHIIAIAKGGSNTVRNIQLLCESCNRAKSDSEPGTF